MNFYTRFNDQKRELTGEIDRIKTVEDKTRCLEKLTELSQECKGRLHELPQYDQKIYTEQLQKLSDAVEGKLVAKKFSFRNRAKQNKPDKAEEIPAEPKVEEQQQDVLTDLVGFQGAVGLPGKKICNVSGSTIRLTGVYPVVQIDNVQNSTIFVECKGPIHLTGVVDSTLVVKCHQFRMHESRGVKVYIDCHRPIIENCTGIGFNGTFEGVDDFNWIRKEQSINWERIPDEDFTWLSSL